MEICMLPIALAGWIWLCTQKKLSIHQPTLECSTFIGLFFFFCCCTYVRRTCVTSLTSQKLSKWNLWGCIVRILSPLSFSGTFLPLLGYLNAVIHSQCLVWLSCRISTSDRDKTEWTARTEQFSFFSHSSSQPLSARTNQSVTLPHRPGRTRLHPNVGRKT